MDSKAGMPVRAGTGVTDGQAVISDLTDIAVVAKPLSARPITGSISISYGQEDYRFIDAM